jgi:hypothetical protein
MAAAADEAHADDCAEIIVDRAQLPAELVDMPAAELVDRRDRGSRSRPAKRRTGSAAEMANDGHRPEAAARAAIPFWISAFNWSTKSK